MTSNSPLTIEQVCEASPVMPVVKVPTPETGVGVANALLAGGIPTIELTLRTDTALETIRAIAEQVPDILLGAGTVTTPEQAAAAVAAGARFVVSPGSTPQLMEAVKELGVPALLGAATPSEMMALADAGVYTQKFFPAEAAGGMPYLSSVAGPLPQLQFCPTGGVSMNNAADYLALPNVPCVGGSWLTPASAVEANDWTAIASLAAAAAGLRK